MKQNEDTHRLERRQLVESLRARGGIDENVLRALEKLPREVFINPSFINRAYHDSALPIDCKQTISQPYTVAYMTSQLKVQSDDKVLEIGTGSGYQAALLKYMGARVYSIERIPELLEQARKAFRKLDININTRLGDGTLGWREFAPYDGIIITAAAPKLPTQLFDQLAIGGRMVVPVGGRDYQTMYVITRESENDYHKKEMENFKFVPLIGKEGWSE
ncbi:MAG: protein-L-isoaspartate(D-aspartate) O-methyltransferase [Candidatus Kapaibacterium sp.]